VSPALGELAGIDIHLVGGDEDRGDLRVRRGAAFRLS
jgi:hypothetical protein